MASIPTLSPPLYMGCRDHIASTIMMYADFPPKLTTDSWEEQSALKEIIQTVFSRSWITTYDPLTLTSATDIMFNTNDDLAYWEINREGQTYLDANHLYDVQPLTSTHSLVTKLSPKFLQPYLEKANRISLGLSDHPLSSYHLCSYLHYAPSLKIEDIDTVGQRLGEGAEGTVYDVELSGSRFALKTAKLSHIKESDQRAFSLQNCLKFIHMMRTVPPHPHVLHFRSLAFVKPLRIWGTVFEKIQGETLENWLAKPHTETEITKVLIGHIKGMQHLDQSMWPFRDAFIANFMVRESDQEGVVIDWATDSSIAIRSTAIAYMARVYWSKMLLDNYTFPPKVRTILEKASQSDIPMETLGWGEMIHRLSAAPG